jgi:hypothetical protein
MASEATTKNQPPDIDIMVFQMRPGDEEDHREGEEAQHRHRLKDVERRDDDELGLAAFGGERGHHEGEQQRGHDGREHAQGRAQRIFRQVGRIERDRLGDKPRGGRRHFTRAVGQHDERARNQNKDREIVEVGAELLAAQPEWLGGRAAVADCRHPRFLHVSSVAPIRKRERGRLGQANSRDLVFPGDIYGLGRSRTATVAVGRNVARSRVHRVPCDDRCAGEYARMENPSSAVDTR